MRVKRFLLVVCLLLSFLTNAQFQRIAVAAGEILTMESAANTASVASYCMDLFAHSPAEYKALDVPKPQYDKILSPPSSCKVFVGNNPVGIPLKEAIGKGIVSYKIDDFKEIVFERGPYTSEKITVKFTNNTYWGNGDDNLTGIIASGLTPRRTFDPITQKYFGKDFTQQTRQSLVWGMPASTFREYIEEIQTVLSELAIYKGPADGKSLSTVDAIKSFNKKCGLPETAAWSSDNIVPFEIFLDQSTYGFNSHPGKINGYLNTDNEGISTYLIKAKKDNYLVTGTFKEYQPFKIKDFKLLDDNYVTASELSFSGKVLKAGHSDVKAGYVSSISPSKEATFILGGEQMILRLTNGTDLYSELYVQLNEQIQKRHLKEITFFADELKNQGFGEADFGQVITTIKDRTFINLPRLVHDLGEANPSLTFYISSDIDHFEERIKTMPGLKSKEDIHLIIPEKSFSNTDIISDAQLKKISDNGLSYSKVRPYTSSPKSAASNIIIYSGDNGTSFYNFLEAQASGDNFKDKILILFSCHTPEDIANYSKLIDERGLKAIYFYPYKINPVAVQLVLKKLGTFITEPLNAPEFAEVLKKAVRAALKDAEREPEALQNEIKKMENFIRHVYLNKSKIISPQTKLS